MDYISRPSSPILRGEEKIQVVQNLIGLAWLIALLDIEGFVGLLFSKLCKSSICYCKFAISSFVLCKVARWSISISIVEVRLVTSWLYLINRVRISFCIWLFLAKIWLILSPVWHDMSKYFQLHQLPLVSRRFWTTIGRVHTLSKRSQSVQGLVIPSFAWLI